MAEQENHHGWAPDVAGDDPTAAEAADKAREASGSRGSEVAADRTQSPTDMEPDSSDSSRRGAEEIAADDGREAEGHKGASQRPYGSVD
ncbi:hypothetical protein [Amycolatopsis sp. NPDC051371]|uniref:hypothetical protein n=1 Tax=Amycolatopsis sp. NPDC051371 TaxID=3155800 RepID=UPI003419BC54